MNVSPQILVVEDTEINRNIMRELLERDGFRVVTVNNGSEAVYIVQEYGKGFDIVFMDLVMPGLGGCDATRIIRNNPHFRDLPIIAMTADSFEENRQVCTEAGMNDFISKPFNLKEIKKILFRWVKPEKISCIDSEKIFDAISEECEVSDYSFLSGIQADAALAILEGNEKLFKKILFTFYELNGNMDNEIYENLNSGDLEKARLLAHSMKGIAGHIGAKKLQSASEKLEKSIVARKEDKVYTGLKIFSDALKQVANGIGQWISHNADAKQKQENIKNTLQTIDKKTIEADISLLKTLLNENDMEAFNLIEDLCEKVKQTEFENDLLTVRQYIEHYDFNNALEAIGAIRRYYES